MPSYILLSTLTPEGRKTLHPHRRPRQRDGCAPVRRPRIPRDGEYPDAARDRDRRLPEATRAQGTTGPRLEARPRSSSPVPSTVAGDVPGAVFAIAGGGVGAG